MSKADVCFAIWAAIGCAMWLGTFLVGAYLDGKKNREFEFDNWVATGFILAAFWPLLPLLPVAMLIYFCLVSPIEWLCKKANQAGRAAVMPPLNQHPTGKPVEKYNACCHLISHVEVDAQNRDGICGHLTTYLDCIPCVTKAKKAFDEVRKINQSM